MRLELSDLAKDFSGVPALSGVNLSVETGSIHAICGENGAGKSTLLKILAGCWPQGTYQGQIRLDGVDVSFSSPRLAEHAGVALVAQELALVPALSVAENISLGAEPARLGWLDRSAMRDTAREVLAKVGLDIDPATPCEQLSVGNQQLVEIARALSRHARLLILDEPTAALGENDALRLEALVRELAAQGVTCLYVSHRMDEVFRVATHITVLRDGQSVRSAPIADWTRDSVISAMVGRALGDAHAASSSSARAKIALRVEDLNLEHPSLPGRMALQEINLTLRQGEIVGLGGLMGSGRSALLSTLYGAAHSAARGRIQLGDNTLRALFEDPRQALERGVVMLSEDRKRMGLIQPFSVAENITLIAQGRGRGLLAPLDHRGMRQLAEAQREKLRVKTASLDLEITSLSGGNQQKVLLGRALPLDPRVLLLDEPTRGIDVGARAEIYTLVRELAASGLAVLFASSDLPELLGLADRILVLSQGRITAELQKPQFSQEAVMRAATL